MIDNDRPYESFRIYTVIHETPGGSTITSIQLADWEKEALTIRTPEPRAPLPVARIVRR